MGRPTTCPASRSPVGTGAARARTAGTSSGRADDAGSGRPRIPIRAAGGTATTAAAAADRSGPIRRTEHRPLVQRCWAPRWRAGPRKSGTEHAPGTARLQHRRPLRPRPAPSGTTRLAPASQQASAAQSTRTGQRTGRSSRQAGRTERVHAAGPACGTQRSATIGQARPTEQARATKRARARKRARTGLHQRTGFRRTPQPEQRPRASQGLPSWPGLPATARLQHRPRFRPATRPGQRPRLPSRQRRRQGPGRRCASRHHPAAGLQRRPRPRTSATVPVKPGSAPRKCSRPGISAALRSPGRSATVCRSWLLRSRRWGHGGRTSGQWPDGSVP